LLAGWALITRHDESWFGSRGIVRVHISMLSGVTN
jgi:hypothetical protein